VAKYTAAPHYVISGGIEFTAFGTYETEDAEKIALLDSLAPLWITREDEPEEPAQVNEVDAEEKPAKAPSKPRKASATSSAK
jgi:hypothetical protein